MVTASNQVRPALARGADHRSPERTAQRTRVAVTIAFFACHAPLAILMRDFSWIATLHALACVVVGLFIALTARRIQALSPMLAYIAGSEVLWRMNHADVPWEIGKYAGILLMLVALMRIRVRRNRGLAIAYFALLLPSCILTLATLDLDRARQEISFYLSGPCALMMAVLFFSNIRLTALDLRKTFLSLIGPVFGIAALAFRSTMTHADLDFVNGANYVTSAGFGPNQVAAMLGLGLMFALLVVIDRKLPWRVRAPLFVMAIALAAQTALTFARGGLVLAFAGIFAALFYLVRGTPRARVTIILVASLSFVAGKYIVEPRLEHFTGGELTHRFTSTKTDGRDVFVASELEFFEEHPILGVGPGVGAALRAERDMFRGASHTEYSRMLAEHGILGLLSLVCLITLGVRAVRRAHEPQARGYAAAMVVWVALFLLVYSTRLFAPSLLAGLAFAVSVAPRPARAEDPHLVPT